jgi:hypothetical protein
LLTSFVVLSLLVVAGEVWLNSMRANIRALAVKWQPDGEIRFYSVSDGPFVITHLVKHGSDEGGKAVARLPQPLAIVDSAGATLSKNNVAKLAWVNIYGQLVTSPKAGAEIKALYFRPEGD